LPRSRFNAVNTGLTGCFILPPFPVQEV
jgi:hypothetical protein